MDIWMDPNTWVALLALASLEIVLGIDNLVFIAILADRLPPEQRSRARVLGLALALLSRLALLATLSVLIGLTEPWLTVGDHELSGRDLILLAGGLFLLWKSTTEIHHLANPEEETEGPDGRRAPTLLATVVQIGVIDVVFSLDSVITALGMADELAVMVAAVVIAMIVMMLSARAISEFIAAHPALKVLALSFLTLIGVLLTAEAFGVEVPKSYVYFAMGYALVVELLNMRVRSRGPKSPATPSLSS